MTIVRKFGVLSTAEITAILYAIMGLIFGLLYAIFVSLTMAIAKTGPVYPGLKFAGVGLVWVIGIIVFPILYGIIGFIVTIIGTALYNAIAPKIGGIKIELETETRQEGLVTS